jgi:hypothetical protein
VLTLFQPAVAEWFRASFEAPTPPQSLGWPAIARGESTLILAPTGSGKTLTAFLWCINRIMFDPVPPKGHRCRVLYISPLKALAVDVERNLRAPLAGIANRAIARADVHHQPTVAIRTGDTPAIERARFLRDPADILITTPESLYLLLTSNSRESLRSIDTVIVDEIHALVPTKRGAHLALSLERLEVLLRTPSGVPGRVLQRIGLSAKWRDSWAEGWTTSRARRHRFGPGPQRHGRRPAEQGLPGSTDPTRRFTPSSRQAAALRNTARSRLSTPRRKRSSICASKCLSRTWRGLARPMTSPAGPPRGVPSANRSGPLSIRACSSSCWRTVPR